MMSTQRRYLCSGRGGGWLRIARLSVVALLMASAAPALVIYRFGGQQLPPPPEADSAGVEFVQLDWLDVDPEAGGALVDVDASSDSIAALRRNPQVDIAPTALDNDGRYIRPSVNGQVWDGDTSTVWEANRYLCAEFDEKNYFLSCTDDFGTPGTASIDLGGFFLVDRVRIVSGLRDPARTVQAARVWIDREFPRVAAQHHPKAFEGAIAEVRDNRQQILDIDIPATDPVRFVQVQIGEHDQVWDVHDIQIFATGFAQRSTYVSNIIDFGQPMAWGDLLWTGDKGEQAKVSVQTRSGTDTDPVRYWRYTGRGTDREEVTAEAYESLRIGERAGTTYDQDHWSFWTSYAFADSAGTAVVSPGPRRYFQFQVDFLPQGEQGGRVTHLELRASEPLATALVGEVWPVTARVGESTAFTYVLRPTVTAGQQGFDQIELASESLLGAVREVRIGDVPVPFTTFLRSPHRLVLDIPRVGAGDTGALVEVDFEAQVLRFGSTFEVRVSNRSTPLEVAQRATGGDATGAFEGNRVSVETTTADEGRLLQVRVPSPVATPNGDGVNDTAQLAYEIFEITGTASVEVSIYDLSGRRVRSLHSGPQGIGSYTASWDGADGAGRRLPPGIYPYSVSLEADEKEARKVGVLYVAY